MQLKTGLILIFIDKSPKNFFSNVKKGYMHTPTERIVHFLKTLQLPKILVNMSGTWALF